MQSVLADVTEVDAPTTRDASTYYRGNTPSRQPDRPHGVVLCLLPDDGGTAAANACANLSHHWPVRLIVMCGIACGVPCPDNPQCHVRLGDILVADEGVIPYGHLRVSPGHVELRRAAAKPSVVLKNATRRLRTEEEAGQWPWEHLLDVGDRPNLAAYRRPAPSTDVLYDDANQIIAHPPADLSGHRAGRPKVHYGRMGSGGKLIRSAAERNRLARRYRLMGLDMEGDGVSDSAYLQGVDWFMVRGVSDYGVRKNDVWHRYAALAAAAYVHALLSRTKPVTPAAGPLAASPSRGGRFGRPVGEDIDLVNGLVAALLDVRTMRDRDGRDRIIAELPKEWRARLERATDAYHDVRGLVHALYQTAEGMPILVTLLRSAEGDSAPVQRLSKLIGTRSE